MKKVRIGVFGVGRGSSMINYCRVADNAQLVAVCDKWEEGLNRMRASLNDESISYYTSFDDFLQHDMDAVVLANYANEHAPFAIRCLKAGLHVYSEVLPVQMMKEAVELIEAVEESGKIYAYGENYCYMAAPYEMRRLYREGKIGEFEYGEGEYVHNCNPIWHSITYGDKNHWRNSRMYANFYCTHSIGPLIHITGLRPTSVVGFEGTKNERRMAKGGLSGQFGIEMITLDNGGIIKSIHGDLYRNSIWYTVYGSKGRMESAREDAEAGGVGRIYVYADDYPEQYKDNALETYMPESSDLAKRFGHGGSDFVAMYNFVEKVLGNPEADTIDVYEALDMFLPGIFAYRSVLNGGTPMEIPDLRDKSVRDQWRGDTMCADPAVAGDMLVPPFSKGTPEIDDSVYEAVRALWEKELSEKKNG